MPETEGAGGEGGHRQGADGGVHEVRQQFEPQLHQAPRAENAKINVTDEPYFGTQIVCNYLPFSKAAKGAQGGPQQ